MATPQTESAPNTNGSTLEPDVSGPDTTTAQLSEQLSELETLHLSPPTLPGDPREKVNETWAEVPWRGVALTAAGVAAVAASVPILATG